MSQDGYPKMLILTLTSTQRLTLTVKSGSAASEVIAMWPCIYANLIGLYGL